MSPLPGATANVRRTRPPRPWELPASHTPVSAPPAPAAPKFAQLDPSSNPFVGAFLPGQAAPPPLPPAATSHQSGSMRSALQALVPPEQQRHLERLTSGAQAVANLLRSQHIHPQATPTPPPTTTRQQRKPLRLGTLDDFRTKFNKYYELNRGASPRSEAVTSSAPDVPESAHAESEAFEAEHADTEYAETEYAETEYAESEASDDSDDDSFGGCAGGGTGGGISSGARPQFVRPSAQRPSYGGVPFPSTSTHHDTSSGLAAGRAEAIREERRRERWDSGGSGFNQEEFLRESRMKSDYDRDARLSELRMQNMMASSMRHDDYLYDLRMDELRRG